MLIATWNVNSLKARMPRVEEWLSRVQPDVLCMQETKLANDKFPTAEIAALGYESAHFGQGQWNGVAIVSKVGLENVLPNFAPGVEPDTEARIITATCAGVRISSVYVPNGRSLDLPELLRLVQSPPWPRLGVMDGASPARAREPLRSP